MLKCIHEFCDRIVFEYRDEQLGENGGPVAVINIGERCHLGHEIMLYVDNDSEHMVHNHGQMPIKADSRIHTDLRVLPAAVPNNCIVLGLADCPIAELNAKWDAAATWWRLHRGVQCECGHGVAGEYTVRKRYFRGAVDGHSDIFVDKLRLIYRPLFDVL